MNFLAHLYLSGDCDNIRIGNLIGDFVKGKNYLKYEPDVQKGIIMHRDIDAFTDAHPLFRKTKSVFVPKYHKHAGVIVDIVFDHYLASGWDHYSDWNLHSLARHTYLILVKNYRLVPPRIRFFFPFMIVNNWLESYKKLEFIQRVFQRMPFRTSLPSESDFAMQAFRDNYDQIQSDFNVFFYELQLYISDKYGIDFKNLTSLND